MRIRMKYTVRGSDDGFTLREYRKAQEYEVKADLAQYFIQTDNAEPLSKLYQQREGDTNE